MTCLCGQDVSYELVRQKIVLRLRQVWTVEHLGEITISAYYSLRSLLKVTFSQFCLDQQISQAHVDFGAIESSICHRDACPESEMWICSWLYIKYRIDSPVPEYAGIAEHVHQQGVGTGAGIKFSPLAAFTPGKRLTLSMHLFQTVSPAGVLSDRAVRRGEEISVARIIIVGFEANRWGLSVTQTVGQLVFSGVDFCPVAEFMTEQAGAVHP